MVAIAGLVTAIAVVNLLPTDRENARREAAHVALAIEHARDSAWFGGRPTSVTFGDGRLREWRLDAQAWRPDTAHESALPATVGVLAMYVDGQRVPAPLRLVFLPDGLGIPFSVALEVRGERWSVEGDAAGAVRLEER